MKDIKNNSLCDIMKRFGSDKSTFHNYTKIYTELFKSLIDDQINFFELGIGTTSSDFSCNMGPNGHPGASLRGWKEYFPKANIYSADIDARILFEEDRIQTFYCDQTDPKSIKEMWGSSILKDVNFDIMIDDGWHQYLPNLTFFENSIHKLKRGGYYIIEDLLPETWDLFDGNLENLENKYPDLEFMMIKINPRNKYCGDNNLLIIKK